MKTDPPLSPASKVLPGRILPPDSFVDRWRHYSQRYGVLHALFSYIGRFSFTFWKIVGPFITRQYLSKWMENPGPHIVNLGGGSVLHERWLTADVDPRSDVWTDITRTLPFPSDSIDGIYLEEVIEHISRPIGERLLTECLRVMKPGARIRMTTPSLNYFMRQTIAKPVSTDAINDIFYLHGHRHIYSNIELENLLHKVGFEHVTESEYRDSGSEFGQFDTHPVRFPAAPPECSQYWDAQKRLN